MKRILVIIICLFIITGCGSKVDEYNSIIDKDNYIVVDVRTYNEYKNGHVVGAINIPYDTIDENVNLDKKKDIFVYCASGGRSKIAYDELTKLGYHVYDLGAYDSVDFDKTT